MDDSRETSSSASADEPFADTALAGGLEQLLYELARAPAREPKLGPGSILGRFAVHEAIGRGAFGIVYAALDTELGRDVAVKLMRTRGDAHDDASRALGSLFKREAEMAARLNHPNIVTLHDHGTVDGWPYLILELLRGETLESRIDHGPLTVEEAVPLMIQVAHGLRYAHRMGVVHRDLKPSNLFLTSDGQMKILDFGLARLQAAVGTAEVSEKVAREPGTRHTAGTPAYMAPEQWRGEPPDERTDVYAAGLILYEMLAGQRPWPAAEPRVSALAPQPAPRLRGVPDALADLVARALVKDRNDRLPTSSELVDRLHAVKRALDSARTLRRTRMVRRALIASVPLLVGAGWAGVSVADWLDRERTISAYLREAEGVMVEARAREAPLQALRNRAFADFDGTQQLAEREWKAARAAGAAQDRTWARAGQILERALALDGERTDVSGRLGEVLLARALIAERDHRLEQRDELAERLAIHGDDAARARWAAAAHLSVVTYPPATILLRGSDPAGKELRWGAMTSPIRDFGLSPGSYLLIIASTGRPEVRYPLLLGRGETLHVSISIPARVPTGFVYVPPGRFLYGSPDEATREGYGAQAEHEVMTGAYLIARHEVTFGDWIDYLEDLPIEERARRSPQVDPEACATSAATSGANDLALRRLADGEWQLTLREHQLRESEPFRYADRSRRSEQRWPRFPVSGVSFDDGMAYATWLDRTGRVPGARLCTEHEWERAARGADGRVHPHGDWRGPDDANVDITYGRKSLAFGPDEVGSHPASNSPFGVADMAGNVWEWTRSAGESSDVWERGGGWYQDALTTRSYNREFLDRTFRSSMLGLRMCATVADH